MRLFVAIQCPEEIESILRNCQKNLENDYAEIRFADSFHITLKFLGEVDEKNIPLIKEALSKIRQKKFRVSLCGLGAFPNMSHPNVLWTGITPSEELDSLQRNVNSCLPAKMTFAKNEDFHPHITLCRIKTVYDKEKFESSINKMRTENPTETEGRACRIFLIFLKARLKLIDLFFTKVFWKKTRQHI